MQKIMLGLLLFIFFMFTNGCGTIMATYEGGTIKGMSARADNGEWVYSGVKTDKNLIFFQFALPLVFDLPLSFVLDTLLLPITIPLEAQKKQQREERKKLEALEKEKKNA